MHTQGKKKANPIVIPSVRFTKLIIHHLQSKHKFHPRPDSPLHLPFEEYVLGYLKFSAKGTKQEVFGMPILNDLITPDIRGGQYYNAYLEKVAKHQRYLADEEDSDPDSPAPKPAKTTKPKATKKSKPSAPKAAPETSDEPSPAKGSKLGLVTKRRKPTSSLRLVDEFVDEGIPENEPRFDDEEADMQRAVEESLKDVYAAYQGPLPPVVFREPDFRRRQPLLEVQDEKATLADVETDTEELLIPTEKSGEEVSNTVVLGIYTGSSLDPMDEGFILTAYPNVLENLKLAVEEQFINDKPSKAENEKTTTETEAESMVSVTIQQDSSAIPPMTTPVIDLISRPDSPNVHWLLPATTTTTATATATTTTTILPPPPQPQQSTTNSILIKRIGELEQIMANLIHDKSQLEERLDKHGSRLYKLENLDIPHYVSKVVDEIVTDVVDWAIQAPLRDRFRDLPEANMKEILHHRMWESNSYKAHEDHKKLYEALENSMDCDQTDQLLTDLAEARRKKKRRHDSPKTPPGSPPHQPPPPPPPAGPSGTSRSSGASGSSQLPPPPPPLSTNQSDQSKTTVAPISSKTVASAEYTAWTTIDTRLNPSVLSIPEDLHMDDDSTLDEQVYSSDDEDTRNDYIPKVNLKQDWWKPLSEEDRHATPEPAWSIPSSDLPVPMNNWASALVSTYAPPSENSLLAQTGDMAMFMDWYCKKQGITELKQKDLEGLAFEIVKVFHPNVIHLQFQMKECHKLLTDRVDDAIIRYNVSKPLPLGGQLGQVTIQTDFFFNKDLEYLRYGSKGGRPALSISKMKAAYYPDVGLEQMVPDQIHTSEGDRKAVRTHMRILSVVRIEVFSLYGYDYMKKIVLRRANLKEHIIMERGFKYLYLSDFENLYLLNLQGHLDHLPPKDKKILSTAVNLWTRNLVIRQWVEDFQLGIESYQTQLNLTKPRWDATGFEYKHDFTVIESPRSVTFRDKYGVQMIMRFNEIHKFSDDTLHQIDEALDYKVKEFKVNKMNPSLNTQFWTRKDVERSKEFIFSI
ncbi:hypothetical protein Tco_0947510 [Tanacetum coccineum]